MGGEIVETGITIDHETGAVSVDTRSRAFASMCRRAGLKETTKTNSAPYVRFRGDLDLIYVIIRKRPSGQVSQKSLDALRMAQEARSESGKIALESTLDPEEV